MKLSNLSIAIFAALSLAACGGSSDDQTTPDSNATAPGPVAPTPTPGPVTPVEPPVTEQPGEVEQEIVDPAQTGVVGRLDFKKEPSQGTLQYIRDGESLFDRLANKEEATSATSILGVDADSQNPKFTNIVRARLLDDNLKVKVIQYLGQDREIADNINGPKSLQRQNDLNVKLRPVTTARTDAAGKDLDTPKQDSREWDAPVTATTVNDELVKLNKDINVLQANLKKLSLSDKEKLAEAVAYKKQLESLQKQIKASKGKYGVDLVSLRNNSAGLANANVFGDIIETAPHALGADGVNSSDDGPEGIGLVGVNYLGLDNPGATTTPGAGSANPVKKISFQGLEEDSRSSTRIFGRYYNTQSTSTADYYNSYSGATTFIPDARVGYVNNTNADPADVAEAIANLTFVDGSDYKNNTVLTAVANLAAEPLRLNLVQYGRVTGDLDPVEYTRTDGEVQYVRSPFLRKGDEKAVDTYFYRGADATTVEEMQKLAKDLGERKVTYNGHALMYGIDNSYHGGKGKNDIPTAIGVGAGSHALGNFVEATVDLANARVDGTIYNVWKRDDSVTSTRDTLVEFDGKVHGNTVLGEATRIYDDSDKADLRASFFGEKASELGGAINSTTWQERYGAKGDVWGGVFGAQRSADPVKGLGNLDVGDVADVR